MDWNDILTLSNTSETIAVYGFGAYVFLSRVVGAWRGRRKVHIEAYFEGAVITQQGRDLNG